MGVRGWNSCTEAVSPLRRPAGAAARATPILPFRWGAPRPWMRLPSACVPTTIASPENRGPPATALTKVWYWTPKAIPSKLWPDASHGSARSRSATDLPDRIVLWPAHRIAFALADAPHSASCQHFSEKLTVFRKKFQLLAIGIFFAVL